MPRTVDGIEWQSISTATPKAGARLEHKLAERAVVGLVDRVDAGQRLLHVEGAGVDLLALRDDAGDRAEAAGDAHRADVGVGRQVAREHLRVEFVGLAVHVEPGARKVRLEQRAAERGRVGDQLVDVGVFGAADGLFVEARGGEEIAPDSSSRCGAS